jgi:IS30 family transposase
LHRQGRTRVQIAKEVGRHVNSVGPLLVRDRVTGTAFADWDPGPSRLSLEDREEIAVGLAAGDTYAAIGGRIGRPASTVWREADRNGGPRRYRASRAHRAAFERSRRPKPAKLASCPRLQEVVLERLRGWWSPEEITRHLPIEFKDDPMMRVSHETIYQSIYVQGRGELRRELARCLRSGRAERKVRGSVSHRGKIPGMVMISERPAEAEDRAVPGHWEGDTVLGTVASRSAVGTLVERSSRFVILLHLPEGRSAEAVRLAMTEAVKTLPDALKRTITWDQGKEMSQHAEFTIDTGIQVYFCDPHSPWQRGSNENTNGLLRQYMPKGTDLSKLTAEDLRRFADSLNNRPRKTLGWMTPREKLNELIALAA